MTTKPTVLVVDDEEIVCRSCRRVLEQEGYRVDSSTDAVRGLELAASKRYCALLLDLKMSAMDGLVFLDELQRRKPSLPVIIITGYPSLDSAAKAMRMGAADYIAKPFMPEEIVDAVRRITQDVFEKAEAAERAAGEEAAQAAALPAGPTIDAAEWLGERPLRTSRTETPPFVVAPWSSTEAPCRFRGEAWIREGDDGSVRVGPSLPRLRGAVHVSAQLPSVGDTVYRGLPLAAFTVGEETYRVVPSPVTGVVVEVNVAPGEDPAEAWHRRGEDGWVARILPRDLRSDLAACRRRTVVLVNRDLEETRRQRRIMDQLGFETVAALDEEDLLVELDRTDDAVVVLDAASLGMEGPALARTLERARPGVRAIVVAPLQGADEAAYREHGIYFYALEPFADQEILDILTGAFATQAEAAPAEVAPPFLPTQVRRIRTKSRRGIDVCLLVASGPIHAHRGLGLALRRRLLEGGFPIETTRGPAPAGANDLPTSGDLQREWERCDHLVLINVRDRGGIPGQLEIRCQGGPEGAGGVHGKAVTTLLVQPGREARDDLGLDATTTAALADQVMKVATED